MQGGGGISIGPVPWGCGVQSHRQTQELPSEFTTVELEGFQKCQQNSEAKTR